MPFKLRKVPRKDLYWVVDDKGKHYSREGMPKERAKEQLKALYVNVGKGKEDDKKELVKGFVKTFNASPTAEKEVSDILGIIFGKMTPEPAPVVHTQISKDDPFTSAPTIKEGMPTEDELMGIRKPKAKRARTTNASGKGKPKKEFIYVSKNPSNAMVREEMKDIEEDESIIEEGMNKINGIINKPKLSKDDIAEIGSILSRDFVLEYDLVRELQELLRQGKKQEFGDKLLYQLDDYSDIHDVSRALARTHNRPTDKRADYFDEFAEWINDEKRTITKLLELLKNSGMPENQYTHIADLWYKGKHEEVARKASSWFGITHGQALARAVSRSAPERVERYMNKGYGAIPQLDVLQKIAKQSYSSSPMSYVGPFKLLYSTPTLKFYGVRNEEGFYDTIIVGIRGTIPTDKQDLWADTQLAIGRLESTPRFKNDLKTLEDFKKRQEFPEEIDYYGVGHSLGGAILDAFLKKGLLQKGVSYNPAISLGDQDREIDNRRIYQDGDPLLSIMGRSAKNVEVRPKKKKSVINRIVSHIPYVGFVKDKLDAHALDNFVGGTNKRKRQETQSDIDMMKEERELERIRAEERLSSIETYKKFLKLYEDTIRDLSKMEQTEDVKKTLKETKEKHEKTRLMLEHLKDEYMKGLGVCSSKQEVVEPKIVVYHQTKPPAPMGPAPKQKSLTDIRVAHINRRTHIKEPRKKSFDVVNVRGRRHS